MPRRLASAAVPVMIQLVCGTAFASGVANLWLDVPFVQQQKDGCGAASIAMVMQYWEQHQGQPVHPEAAAAPDPARLVLRPGARHLRLRHGALLSAKRLSRLCLRGPAGGPRARIAARPPADRRAQTRPLGPSLHYVVVVGLDEPQKLVLVNDPAQRKLLKEDQSQFEREWKAAGHWILLAVPEASSPDASKYIDANFARRSRPPLDLPRLARSGRSASTPYRPGTPAARRRPALEPDRAPVAAGHCALGRAGFLLWRSSGAARALRRGAKRIRSRPPPRARRSQIPRRARRHRFQAKKLSANHSPPAPVAPPCARRRLRKRFPGHGLFP